MNMHKAIEVLGINRTRDGDLRPMVRALCIHSWINTAEDRERLMAARYVLRRWDEYTRAGDAQRRSLVRGV